MLIVSLQLFMKDWFITFRNWILFNFILACAKHWFRGSRLGPIFWFTRVLAQWSRSIFFISFRLGSRLRFCSLATLLTLEHTICGKTFLVARAFLTSSFTAKEGGWIGCCIVLVWSLIIILRRLRRPLLGIRIRSQCSTVIAQIGLWFWFWLRFRFFLCSWLSITRFNFLNCRKWL